MQDRPNALELVAAVQHFLETEILPIQDDQRVKFRTRVAVNALAILQRELGAGSTLVDEEAERLRMLLQGAPSHDESRTGQDVQQNVQTDVQALRRELARRIRTGEADHGARRQAVLASTLASVRAKLVISNPNFADQPVARYPSH